MRIVRGALKKPGWGVLAGALLTLPTLFACGDDVAPTDPPVATEVSIYPESVTLSTLGETVQFFAAVSDQYGEGFAGTITWSSSAPGVFAVDSNGMVTAVANGSGTLTASYESLSASATVTVDANRPPLPRGQFPDHALSVGGGSMGVLVAGFFEDPEDDLTDLTFTTRVSDSAVATADVVVDSQGHIAVVLTGTAVGTTDLTIVATDPGGLSAEQSAALTVDGEGATPFPTLRVSDNRIDIGAAVIVESCSPPFIEVTFQQGFVVTVNYSIWQERTDSTAAWTSIEETARADGAICSYTTTVGGEYRLVFNMTWQIDPHHDPLIGNYRSENTFTVVDTGSGNRAPTVNPAGIDKLTVGTGGGPLPFVAGRFFTDPDGDPLTFTVNNSDPASLSAKTTVDSEGHTVIVLSGVAEGMSTFTVTATDPGGLSADWTIDVIIEDSGYTPLTFIAVGNGVLHAVGSQLATCLPPIVNQPFPDGNVYTVHVSKWQRRTDAAGEWSDLAGTERTDGLICPHSATDPGDYRLVYEMSILFDPHLPPTRGWYRSPNYFTVSASNSALEWGNGAMPSR